MTIKSDKNMFPGQIFFFIVEHLSIANLIGLMTLLGSVQSEAVFTILLLHLSSIYIKDIPFHIMCVEFAISDGTLFRAILESSHFGIDKISKAGPKTNNISANKSHYVTNLVQNAIYSMSI